MSYFVVDVESDGPAPGLYSMVCFGAIKVDDKLIETFYGETKPITDTYLPEALAISGFSREEHLNFQEPLETMLDFYDWINRTNSSGRSIMISDNIAYDWQFINYYFHKYKGANPFGFSGRRIGDLYCGMQKSSYAKWKHLRTTKHTHNPIDDARGNAEALLKIRDMGLDISFK